MMNAISSVFSSPSATTATAAFPQKDAYERAIAITPAVTAAATTNKRPRSIEPGDVNNLSKKDQNAWLKKQLETATSKIAELNEAVQLEITRLRGDPTDTAILLHGTLLSPQNMTLLKGHTWKRDIDLETLRGLFSIDATITAIDTENAHLTRLRDDRIATFTIPRALFDRTLSFILVRPATDGGLIRGTVAIPVMCKIQADARIQLVVPAHYDQEGGIELVKISKAELITCAVVKYTPPLPPTTLQPPEDTEDTTPQPPEDADVPQPPPEDAVVSQPIDTTALERYLESLKPI
ncbi:hypothetical protein B484DRAFT_399790 [Ochromonadaceae sp. CCMP2298]|nr:hypothetical protein B484DRAFT_399790 [Ochromonadaceae sp. CCMP2298]